MNEVQTPEEVRLTWSERLARLILGRYVATREGENGPFEAVPAMGLDGLGSSAYSRSAG